MVRVLGVILLWVAASAAAQQIAPPAGASTERSSITARDSLPAYGAPDSGSEPLARLQKGEKLKVLGEEKGYAKVQLPDGRTGFVPSDGLHGESRQSLYLNELKVFGFLDNPEPIYIFDFENDEYKPIRVAKDFVMNPEFMKNISKENFEWENEIYYYKGYDFTPEAIKSENKKIK